MTNNNHKNSFCGFSEQLVSFLYGETGGSEKASFEAHLENCAVCAGELEAFSNVQISINDWKLKEFAPLATPIFEIPFEKTVEGFQSPTGSVSWMATFRDLFSISPAWSLATASLAVLAVCAGIFLFALNSRQGNDIAEGNKPVKSKTAPTASMTPPDSNSKSNSNNEADNKIAPVKENKPDVAVSNETNQKNTRIVKTSNPRQTPKTEGSTKNADVKRNDKTKNQPTPKIMPDDDEEDDSLRLAELFEEIETD